MADEAVRSPGPVDALAGFGGRTPSGQTRQPPPREQASQPAVDRVTIHGTAAVASRLLRERVLANTRQRLELDDTTAAHEFAEVFEGEPIAAFLGRLLSAQNLLAARRAGDWEERRVRRCLDQALHAGAEEALELLGNDGRDDAGVQFVADVLVEYGRRLAALAAESR